MESKYIKTEFHFHLQLTRIFKLIWADLYGFYIQYKLFSTVFVCLLSDIRMCPERVGSSRSKYYDPVCLLKPEL